MSSTHLQQIDHALIQLLGERIALLAQMDRDPTDPPNPTQALAQAGVPEFVWRSLQISCAAATPGPPPHTRPRQVTLIGGSGQMGQFFAQQLSQAEHRVQILGSKDWGQAEQLLTEADLVLICVPTAQVATVVQQAAAYLSPTCAIADITSVKTPAMATMLEHHVGPVLGLHPMFGPGIQTFLSQNVIICPGRYPNAFRWLLDLIVAGGGKLRPCTPTEHDRMMATVQAMRHFSALSLGVFLAQEQTDIASSLEFASPLYRLMLNQVSRLFGQDPALCIEIMLNTDACGETITRLAATYRDLADLVTRKKVSALRERFESARGTFEAETSRARNESNYVIESLSLFLGAQEKT